MEVGRVALSCLGIYPSGIAAITPSQIYHDTIQPPQTGTYCQCSHVPDRGPQTLPIPCFQTNSLFNNLGNGDRQPDSGSLPLSHTMADRSRTAERVAAKGKGNPASRHEAAATLPTTTLRAVFNVSYPFNCSVPWMTLSIDRGFCQGDLIPKGSSGLGVSGVVAADRNATSYGFASGYSFSGRFDIAVSCGRVSSIRTSDGLTIPTTRGTFISPTVTWYVLRQEPGVDSISIGLMVGYEHVTHASSPLGTQTGDVFSGGVSFFQDLLHSSSFKLQPSASITLSSGETT